MKEEFQLLAQLIESSNDLIKKMEAAKNSGNKENYERAEKEILNLQKQISDLLKEVRE